MENLTLQQLITQTKEALTQAGASNYYQKPESVKFIFQRPLKRS